LPAAGEQVRGAIDEAPERAGNSAANTFGDQKMARAIADQFAEIVAAPGVKRIYGIVGDSLNRLTDSLRRQGKIELIQD
jgi:hypothetical protein